jgi:hypothetical protein
MLQNIISIKQRFAKRKDKEYHVFSTHIKDPSEVKDWVAINHPPHVLIDPQTYEQLRNKRIKWVFDDKNVIVGCSIVDDAKK